jgi:peptidoglycan/xylan/chitin deacetylase (PgdA/CDA1 family)
MTQSTLLVVSIDTEEDDWQPRRDGVTVENIRELPRLDALFQRLGVRATYFTTYQVAIRDWAAAVLRELHGAGAELGAHLHPWNTPPLDEPFVGRNTMLKNLPAALQLAKLEHLTRTLREAVGARPVAFRAGRYGLGPDTVTALIRCGYRVDSSVTPFVSWEEYDDGPTFIGAPLHPYRLAGDADVRIPQPGGALAELPMSVGYNRPPSRAWTRVYQALSTPALRPLHLRGLASRAGIVKRVALSPETDSVPDMLTLSRRLIDAGLRHLHLFLHSPSLSPGLSPFALDQAGVEGMYRSIATYVERLARVTALRFVTVSEAASLLQTASAPERAAAARS